MELKKGIGEERILWKLSGKFDDDSTLGFESAILNSNYSGEDLVIDLSNVNEVTDKGLRSLGRVVEVVKNKGANIKIIPPEGKGSNPFRGWILNL